MADRFSDRLYRIPLVYQSIQIFEKRRGSQHRPLQQLDEAVDLWSTRFICSQH